MSIRDIQGMNYTNLAMIRAKAGRSDTLGEALLLLVEPSRQENACISYDVHRSLDDDDLWMVYENWQSAGDLEHHFEQPHMKAFAERIAELVEGGLELKGFTRMTK